jgi:hypothetical protein
MPSKGFLFGSWGKSWFHPCHSRHLNQSKMLVIWQKLPFFFLLQLLIVKSKTSSASAGAGAGVGG